MALVVGTNSYVDVDTAEAFFSDRLDVAAWVSADSTMKAQALVTASQMLNAVSWLGEAASESQLLAFPRSGSYLDPMLGKLVTLDSNVVPQRIIQATMEQAYHLLNNDGLLDSNGTPSRIKVGPIELEGMRSSAPPLFSQAAKRIYGPLVSPFVSTTWWRAN